MPKLTTQDRRELAATIMRQLSAHHEPLAATIRKADLVQAVGALDDYEDANEVTLNQNLPSSVRTGLTARQKRWVHQLLVRRRFEAL